MCISCKGTGLSKVLVVVIAASIGAVHAGDWKLEDSFSASLNSIHRDNESAADTSNQVLRLRPSVRLSGKGGKSSADINYGLSALMNSSSSNATNPISHSLRGTGVTELVDNMFYLRGSVFAGLTTSTNNSATVDDLNPDSETIQTYGFSLSPEFRHHLGRNMDIVSNNVIRYFGSERGGGDQSISRSAHIGITSGAEFSVLSWSLGARNTVTEYNSTSHTVSSYDADAAYRLNRTWALLGGFGYSESDAATRRSSNSAANWSVGVNWTPNPRTRGNARYGQNYSGNIWSGNLTHVTRRTRLGLNVSRALTDSSSYLLDQQDVGLLDPEGSIVTDPLTGDPLLFEINTLVPTNENFINTRISGNATITGKRSSVGGYVSYSKREFDVTGTTQEAKSIRLTGNRRVSPKTSLNFRVGASNFTSTGSDNTTYDVSVGANTRLGRYSSIGGRVTHRLFERSSGTNGFSEQRFSVTFSTRFL